jgi:Fe-S-cluster containining protein
VRRVDDEIFTRRYFGDCMRCHFCRDACCTHGVDVGIVERDRLLARARELEPHVGVPAERWFSDTLVDDADFPGGQSTRTAVVHGACVFLRRDARGCLLHAAALATGEDYHALKPMVSALFPVTFDAGTLRCSNELHDGSLVCAGEGPSAYDMARVELGYYFGPALLAELDVAAAAISRAHR